MCVMESMNIAPSSVSERTSIEGIAVFDKKSGYLHCYNPKNNSWVQMQGMNEEIKNEFFTAVTVDDFIYVLLEDKPVHRLKYLDNEATWEKMTDMLEEHGPYPPAVTLLNYIYVIGGAYPTEADAAEMYDPNLNIWTRLNNISQPLDGPGLTVFQNKIYCFGGESSGEFLNKVDQFDPAAEVWKPVSHMPVANSYTAVVPVGEYIFILGGLVDGFDTIKAVQRFDSISKHWQSRNPMLTSRCSFNAFAIQGFIYAVGGCGYCNSLEKYNIAKDKWELVEIPEEINLSIRGSVKIHIRAKR